MPQLDIAQATKSSQDTVVKDFSVTLRDTDGVGNQKETTWNNSEWTRYWGYFNDIPDLKSAITMKAVWNTGKGYTADLRTEVILDRITGWGKDTFDDILFNMDVIASVNGDSYAEIIRDKETGDLLNLKPLNPGTIRHVVNEQGILERYEQTSRSEKPVKKIDPVNMLHFSNNRLADQIHGISDIVALEETIKADADSFSDTTKAAHRQARPLILFKIKTDDQTKITAFIKKMDEATHKGENIYIPDDDNTVSWEVVQVNISQVLLEWRNDIRNRFYRAIGLPQIVPGGGGQSTESESKVIYFTFEQIVEQRQRKIEKQLFAQIGIKINLIPPATLAQDLQNDERKDANRAVQVAQPADTNIAPQPQGATT